MSMEQKPTRFYITQEEDHTVVRSVPMTRRARNLRAPEERKQASEQAQPDELETRRSVAKRLRAAVKRA